MIFRPRFVSKFLGELDKIDRLIHTKSISLQRAGRTDTTQLDMVIQLFDLQRKAA